MFESTDTKLVERIAQDLHVREITANQCAIPDNFLQIHVLAYQIKLPIIFAIGYFYMNIYIFFLHCMKNTFFGVDH